MPRISHPIAEGIGEALKSIAGGYAQRQERSRVSDLLQKLQTATPMEAVQIYGQIDPELALKYNLEQMKNERAQAITQKYPGLPGGQQQQIQPGFTPNAPSMAARNATAPMMKNFMQQPQVGTEMPPPAQVSQGAQAIQQPSAAEQLSVADQFRKRAADYAAAGMKPQADVDLAEANAIENRVNSQRKVQQQLEFQERKENEGYRQHILNGIPQTKKLKAQIGRIEKLSEKAETTPAAVKALNFFGIPIGAFDTANAQELEKLSNDLTATIQSDYGNRILATEFNTFLKRIPTLLNSEEGRARIIRNMRLYSDAAEAEQKAYQDIYKMQKQSGIQHPIVRQEDVMEYVEPQLDAIFDKLNSELIEDSGTKEASKLLPPSPQGAIRMVKDGKFYDFPADQMQLRKKQGFAPL